MKKLSNVVILAAMIFWFLMASVLAQTATNLTVTVSTVGATTVTLMGTVPAANTMTFAIAGHGCSCAAPTHGTITNFNAATGTLVYAPTAGYTGADSFGFVVIATPSVGDPTNSSEGTVTVTVTDAMTRIYDRLRNPDGSARTGAVTFVPLQATTSPDGLIPAGASKSAILDSNGYFDISVFPSRSLNPQVYYNVLWAAPNNLKRENLGVFDIPASTSTLTLGPLAVTDTNLAIRYRLASETAVEQLIQLSRVIQIFNNGTLVGSEPAIDFIPGSNITFTITDSGGRIHVTINSSAGGGSGSGTVSSGLAGQLAVYASLGNTLSGLAHGAANRILGENGSGNATEWKAITGGTGITVTHSANSIVIAASGAGITSLNGATGSTQSFAIGTTGTNPAFITLGNVHVLELPYAAPAVTAGLVTGVSQTIGGIKTFADRPIVPEIAFAGGLSGNAIDSNAIWNDFNERLEHDATGRALAIRFATSALEFYANASATAGTVIPRRAYLETTGLFNFEANLALRPSGTSAGNTGESRFFELAANGSNYAAVKASDSMALSATLVLPPFAALPTAGQAVIVSNVDNTNRIISLDFGSSGGGSFAGTDAKLAVFASGTLADSSVTDSGSGISVNGSIVAATTLAPGAYAAGALPATGTAGRIVRMTDAQRGLWMESAANKWYSIQGQELNVDEYSSFAAAISAIGSTQTTLTIGNSQTVSTTVTVPGNVTLRFTGQGQLTGSGTVTINGGIEGPARQLFTSALTLNFGGSRVLHLDPHWFGALGDGATDDGPALQRMLNIISSAGSAYSGEVYLAKGVYATKSMLTFEGGNSKGVQFHGALGGDRGPDGTVFTWIGATGGTVLYLLGVNGSTFSDFAILCNSVAKNGIYIDATNEYSSGSTTAISAISRSSNITSVTSTSHGLAVGDTIKIAGVADSTYNGTWLVATVPNANSFTYLNGGSNGSSSSGTALKYQSAPSSGNRFVRITIGNPNGTDSAAIAIGHVATTTEQISEIDFHNLFLQGRQVLNNSYYGIKPWNGGNVKNFRVHSGTVDGFDVGLDFTKGSGIISISDVVMANIQQVDIKVSDGVYHVKSVEVEDNAAGTQFITGSTGNNAGSLTVEGCTWTGIAPASNDSVIAYAGAIVLSGNLFQNNRSGTRVPNVKISSVLFASGSAGSLVSSGNFFQNASGYIPVIDGGDNAVAPGSGVYANQAVAVTSTNDYGGSSGAIVRLSNYLHTTNLISQQASGNLVPSSCLVCMGKSDAIKFRNNAGSGDIAALSKNSSDVVLVGDSAGIAVQAFSSSGQITSTVSTGTAPLVVASTTNVANLNASSLGGATFAAPGTIGGTTPGAATFTTVKAISVSLASDGINIDGYGTVVLLAKDVTVDLSLSTAQALYTVPAGKKLIVRTLVYKAASATLSSCAVKMGFNAGATDVNSAGNDIVGLDATTVFPQGAANLSKIGNAGDVLKMIVSSGTQAATVKVDVFGWLY